MNSASVQDLRSFLPVSENSHFPIQNLPYGIFCPDAQGTPSVGVAIGEWILDLSILETEGFFTDILGATSDIFSQRYLNKFMALGSKVWHDIRTIIRDLLNEDNPRLRDDEDLKNKALIKMSAAHLLLPVQVGNYTDFYSSREHASNVGTMFRGKDNPLLPNWLHLPVAYHGRASSIVPGGTNIVRPYGQTKSDKADKPSFGPCQSLDFELEMGFFIGIENELGQSISIDDAYEHIFGLVLVNDWSARDIQKWEYQPLGPFLGKNFATSISPWIVTLEALEPFRCTGPEQNPLPLPYLQYDQHSAYDIKLEVSIQSESMAAPFTICKSNFNHIYWNIFQQLAHHTINGCNLCTGDLLASGTISGPSPESFGSMLELAWMGTKPIMLPGGEERIFLVDGDSVSITGWCQGEGYRVGFGDVSGKILPAFKID